MLRLTYTDGIVVLVATEPQEVSQDLRDVVTETFDHEAHTVLVTAAVEQQLKTVAEHYHAKDAAALHHDATTGQAARRELVKKQATHAEETWKARQLERAQTKKSDV